MKTIQLSISDMTCASCVNHIQGDVGGLKGVHHAQVNFATNRAEVMFEEDQISTDDIIQQIKKTGYRAKLVSDDWQ